MDAKDILILALATLLVKENKKKKKCAENLTRCQEKEKCSCCVYKKYIKKPHSNCNY